MGVIACMMAAYCPQDKLALPSASTTPDVPYPEKWNALLAWFRGSGQVIIAYSGGVDSTLLMKAGTLAIGRSCLGVIARSETLTDEECRQGLKVARFHDFNIRSITYSELEIDHYKNNPRNRCYFCKRELYSRLRELAAELGIRVIAEGSHVDDVGDWRPGLKAVEELEVISPLRDAGFQKKEIRAVAEVLGLPNWDKPSNPCLSSRIAYGLEIDHQKLEQIARGEKWLRERGFRQVRVRHHGNYARIEVGRQDLQRALEPDMRSAIITHMVGLGFQQAEVDPEGYRTGSLNEPFFRRSESRS